jgi:hypothetical protein
VAARLCSRAQAAGVTAQVQDQPRHAASGTGGLVQLVEANCLQANCSVLEAGVTSLSHQDMLPVGQVGWCSWLRATVCRQSALCWRQVSLIQDQPRHAASGTSGRWASWLQAVLLNLRTRGTLRNTGHSRCTDEEAKYRVLEAGVTSNFGLRLRLCTHAQSFAQPGPFCCC